MTKKRNKIISLLYFCPRELSGGNRTYALNLLLNLDKIKNLRITAYLNISLEKELHKKLTNSYVNYIDLPNNVFSIIKERSIFQKIETSFIDIIHAPCTLIPFYQHNKPMIATIHDLNFLTLDTRKFKYLYKRFLYKYTISKCPRLIAISQFTKNELINFSKNSPTINVVWNGADSKTIKKKNNPRPYLISFGHRAHKNIEQSIKILSKLNQNSYIFDLIIVGSTPDLKQKIIPLAKKLHIEQSLTFLEHIDNDQLEDLYFNATALLFLSKYEGFGLPVIEAMNMRCPVITSNNASLPEIVGQYGLIIDEHQDDIAVEYIISLYSNYELFTEITKKAKIYSSSLSWSLCAHKTSKIYEEVLNDIF